MTNHLANELDKNLLTVYVQWQHKVSMNVFQKTILLMNPVSSSIT